MVQKDGPQAGLLNGQLEGPIAEPVLQNGQISKVYP